MTLPDVNYIHCGNLAATPENTSSSNPNDEMDFVEIRVSHNVRYQTFCDMVYNNF
jgi:hypothetical protein